MQIFCLVIVLIALLETVLSEFAFPYDPSLLDVPYSIPENRYPEEQPSGKHLHKIKKLRKKQRLLCLLASGRSIPYDTPQGKFLLPVFKPIIQQTEVNVGHPGTSNQLSPVGHLGGGGINCDHLLGSGLHGGGLHGGGLSHPILSGLGGVTGGNKPTTDEDEDRYFHRINLNRDFIRPLYKSMKYFYRLFK